MDPAPSGIESFFAMVAAYFESGDGVLVLLCTAFVYFGLRALHRDRPLLESLPGGPTLGKMLDFGMAGGVIGWYRSRGRAAPEADPPAAPEPPKPAAAGDATTVPAAATRTTGSPAPAPGSPTRAAAPPPSPAAAAPAAALLPAWVRSTLEAALGDRYGDYTPLGAGGMGTVVRGFDRKLERPVAIKLPPPHLASHPEFRDRFLREARALARLSHAGITRVHDVPDVPDGEIPVMVLEYLEGVDLAAWLARHGPGPAATVVGWMLEAGAGLAYAHERGVVHRDVKPSNMMLCEGRVHLLDFGLAALEDSARLTTSGMLMGSLPYMPPEQLRGERVGPAADQYSLAASAYELLAGTPPFPAEDQRRTTPPDLRALRPSLPASLAAVLRRGLAPQAADRFPSVQEFSQELGATMAA